MVHVLYVIQLTINTIYTNNTSKTNASDTRNASNSNETSKFYNASLVRHASRTSASGVLSVLSKLKKLPFCDLSEYEVCTLVCRTPAYLSPLYSNAFSLHRAHHWAPKPFQGFYSWRLVAAASEIWDRCLDLKTVKSIVGRQVKSASPWWSRDGMDSWIRQMHRGWALVMAQGGGRTS